MYYVVHNLADNAIFISILVCLSIVFAATRIGRLAEAIVGLSRRLSGRSLSLLKNISSVDDVDG